MGARGRERGWSVIDIEDSIEEIIDANLPKQDHMLECPVYNGGELISQCILHARAANNVTRRFLRDSNASKGSTSKKRPLNRISIL